MGRRTSPHFQPIQDQQMKVSVAVASLNYGRFLGTCLEGLRSQTYSDFEVLIADGGSDDESLDVIREYCERDPRFRLVSTSDKGQADAIQKALSLARGDILGFLNADDFLLCRDAFETIVETFEMHPGVDVVSFGAWYVDESGRTMKPVSHRRRPADNLTLIGFRPQVVQPATYWRKKVSEAIPFRTQFHFVFDSVFFFEAYRRFNFLELGKPIAAYRLHGANKSITVRPARIREIAEFERLKFGSFSVRGAYLDAIAVVVASLERLPLIGSRLSRAVYVLVNSVAFLTAYRLPGI
jgi:glycosyltransferase involved in cell wall biosynthesis